MSALASYIARVADGSSLNETEAAKAADIMMSGEADPVEIAGFLMALRVRGETVDEIAGAAQAMRGRAIKVTAPEDAIDTCGTGGDGAGTYNISTACAFVLAGAGVKVAKHGNRAISSKSGSAQVLEELGVNINLKPDAVSQCITNAGIGFMMAPLHHAAMKHVGPVRQILATRTIFNLLGPLSNPANVKRQIVGVFAKHWVEPVAHVLQKLGCTRAWVVHGSDGLDELTTTGNSFVASLENNNVTTFDVSPEDAGLALTSADDLRGGDAKENAVALKALLEGQKSSYRDIVLLNSAAALIVAGLSDDLRAGAALAAQAIDNGNALTALNKLVLASNEAA